MRVKASDVLDANATVLGAFTAKVVGHFRRMGPNRWDDYQLVRAEGDSMEVFPGVRVQVERRGTRLRLRSQGKVWLVAWTPSAEDDADLAHASATAKRQYFLDHYVSDYAAARGLGAAAVIARKLNR